MNADKSYKQIEKLLVECKKYDRLDTLHDESAAREALIHFFEGFIKIKPDKVLKIQRCGSYYSFYINLIPLRNALSESRYSLACHELITLAFYEPILQKRIYICLIMLYREFLEEYKCCSKEITKNTNKRSRSK